jgi:hypothetical protein
VGASPHPDRLQLETGLAERGLNRFAQLTRARRSRARPLLFLRIRLAAKLAWSSVAAAERSELRGRRRRAPDRTRMAMAFGGPGALKIAWGHMISAIFTQQPSQAFARRLIAKYRFRRRDAKSCRPLIFEFFNTIAQRIQPVDATSSLLISLVETVCIWRGMHGHGPRGSRRPSSRRAGRAANGWRAPPERSRNESSIKDLGSQWRNRSGE